MSDSPIDLSPVREVIEDMMQDEITVTRYAEGAFNEGTMKTAYTGTEIYSGKAMVSRLNPVAAEQDLGGHQHHISEMWLWIPHSETAAFKPNDVVTFDTLGPDTSLKMSDQFWYLHEEVRTSFSPGRKFVIRRDKATESPRAS